ncbi:lipoxygenase 2, chloroplastic-like [Benincasa hispida]|uniref:lipoxygenase 2, chloroplastic-like n=1 Tax=Benincasa hispida TaxID=102211 RepID=UPI001900E72A|nr:lipoxygenase 2, chloroplastic-like [Benincasa hispida]
MGVKSTVVVTVKPKTNEFIPCGEIMFLKFASVELDSDQQQKKFIEVQAEVQDDESEECSKYVAEIEVPEGFGDIGAVIVELDYEANERFIDTVSITDSQTKNSITFSCKSWVQPQRVLDQRRIFFSTKSYLPGRTPAGLLKLRKEDLANLRGQKADGTEDKNERQPFERIYDYDFYNDLGDSDGPTEWKRPVLGGSDEYPYPRRCRTGRPHCITDASTEQRSGGRFYVPRDEEFSEVKQHYFPPSDPGTKDLLGKDPFSDLPQIESMFREGIEPPSAPHKILKFNISSIVSPNKPTLQSSVPSTLLQYPPPEAHNRDRYSWLSDTEFARQTLAGVNPYSIQLVTSLPLMSELDPKIYGPQESAFTHTKVQELIRSPIEVCQAIAEKRLFVLDYHDTLMPYVSEVRKLNGTTLYGSRTLFFLKSDDTLMPLGIELTRPPMDGNPQWKQLFIPGIEATDVWLWRLAKAHVLAHDSCIHQLIIHWLRAHCCMEPYAIATNRQLSTMHPIYRLLHPHFRYNMRINANACESLINAGGIIESTFSTASHSMQLSSSVYKKEWRFDEQALPEDLIRRGMAERKKDAEGHDVLELAIKDYPFANDGLLLWNALLKWVTEYVNHYYGDDENEVMNDKELQAWWQEIREKGHPDKKEGWPALKTRDDLIKIASTIAWVGSGHHSAVNFIQYAYAGYTPNRPSIARTNMLTEDFHQLPEEFIDKPENELLQVFPSVAQATTVTATMYLLSVHSSDEEYIGDEIEPAWTLEPSINKAFKRFNASLMDLEQQIDASNKNNKLKNRRGAGVMPYEVLKPHSDKSGITGKGVPYSVST